MNRLVLLAAGAALALATMARGALAATITIDCGSASDYEFCGRYAQEWGRAHGHVVKLFTSPGSATDSLAVLRQQFAARSPDIDVLRIDVTWPGLLKDHLLDLRPYSHGAERRHFPAIVANDTVDGRLLGMPFFVDAGLLYYRRDLLEKYGLGVPATWAELEQAARRVQAGERAAGDLDFQGFVFPAKASESLTCTALEWVAGFGGGTVVEPDGRISVRNADAARALATAARWVGSIAPRGVLNYGEEDARGVFQNGRALFMRNWPYAWSLSQAPDSPVRGRVGVARLPVEGAARPAAALGGWQLAVSRYSRNPGVAAELLLYMTGPQVQRLRALEGVYNPTLTELYEDRALVAANPLMAPLRAIFDEAVARPASVTGLKYPAVSQVFRDAAHDVLSGRSTATDALRRLEGQLARIRREQW